MRAVQIFLRFQDKGLGIEGTLREISAKDKDSTPKQITLEENGIVEKRAFPGNKVKSLFQLTPKGIDLMPILFEIILWGDEYFEIPEGVHRLAGEIRKDRNAMIKQISKRLAATGAQSVTK